ncbi:MAG: hypothetical protein MHPSP_000610 [Paramarteilia canceri]
MSKFQRTDPTTGKKSNYKLFVLKTPDPIVATAIRECLVYYMKMIESDSATPLTPAVLSSQQSKLYEELNLLIQLSIYQLEEKNSSITVIKNNNQIYENDNKVWKSMPIRNGRFQVYHYLISKNITRLIPSSKNLSV